VGESEVRLYYRNVTAEVIGAEDGISDEQFGALREQTSPLIKKLNDERAAGKTPYRDLPCNEKSKGSDALACS